MGSVCMSEERVFRKIEEYIHPENVLQPFSRIEPNHSRFGNVEKIRTKKSDVYKLIMATKDVKLQTVSIDCRILQSTAEFELYDGTKFQLQDRMVSPLIDLFNSNNNQVYHPIKGQNRNNLLLKSYPFSGYGDNVLKRAVHEIWIYNELRSMSPLVDYFIMSRGKSNTFVMIFKNYETSLLEIVRYRQLANYHWSEAELVMLWKILISNFKQLKNLSICHREIRLGKIFFTSDNRNQPYQFVNLETARKVTKAESNDLLTVVGVDIFAERPMKEKIKSGDELAIYDPFAYDMACFIRVLLSLLNLDPLQKESLRCHNEKLSPIIEKLRSDSPSFIEIQRDLDNILRSMTYEKSELFKEDRIISEHLWKSQLRRKNKEKIQEYYFDALLQLHKKDLLNRLLIEKIEQNENLNRKYENIAILHKVGEYYKRIGLQKNEYFEEEFILLLDLSKQCREQQFYEDHEEYLTQLSKLLDSISKERYDLSIRYYNQLIYKFINLKKIDNANQYLSNLLEQTYKYTDIHINTQIDILVTKAILEIINEKYETAQNTIQKISYIVSNTEFESQYDAKRYQAQLQYLKAYFQVSLMTKNRDQIKKKRVAVAETSIKNAISIFTNLPESNENTIKIINAYIVKADLSSLKQAYPECKTSLDSADMLISQIQKQRSVSDNLKLKVLQRLKVVYERSNKAKQPYYKEILNRLGKITKRFEESNASRHQRSKELRSRMKQRSKQEKMAPSEAIEEQLNEDEP